MIFHHDFSPYMVQFGPVAVRWYGFFYAMGLFTAYLLSEKRLRNSGILKPGEEGRLFNAIILGVIVGARAGYCLVYNLPYYLEHPLEVFFIWNGGLSFHGGFAGVLLALWLMGGRTLRGLYVWGDAFALYTPIGLGLGRLGNFMNSELVGRPTDGSWGVIFEKVDALPRHPSQLYESLLEGLLLFTILRLISLKTKTPGILLWSFVAFYAIFRFTVEFFRQPDEQLGYVLGPLSMGQLLSIPMLLLALAMILILLREKNSINDAD